MMSERSEGMPVWIQQSYEWHRYKRLFTWTGPHTQNRSEGNISSVGGWCYASPLRCPSDFQPRGETSGALSPEGKNVALHMCSGTQINLNGLKHRVEMDDNISMSLYGKMSGKGDYLFLACTVTLHYWITVGTSGNHDKGHSRAAKGQPASALHLFFYLKSLGFCSNWVHSVEGNQTKLVLVNFHTPLLREDYPYQ